MRWGAVEFSTVEIGCACGRVNRCVISMRHLAAGEGGAWGGRGSCIFPVHWRDGERASGMAERGREAPSAVWGPLQGANPLRKQSSYSSLGSTRGRKYTRTPLPRRAEAGWLRLWKGHRARGRGGRSNARPYALAVSSAALTRCWSLCMLQEDRVSPAAQQR